jgi:4-amino-4-deoxy-L-arabinose transferase-like glycosyltransferase
MKIPKRYYPIAIVLIAGFIFRLLYLYYFKETVFFNPFLLDKHDQKTFILWAQQILQNPWYVDGKPFYMAPFYPYFLAVVYAITSGNIAVISVIQLFMDVLLCYFIYYLGSKIYNRWTGLIAAVLVCFYRTAIVYSATILSDGLIYFLYIFFIALVYFALQKPSFVRWLFTGMVLGFAALAKPTIAVYLPFLFIGLYLYPEKDILPNNINRKFQPVVILIILLAVSGFTILPVTIRNYFVSGEFIPICTNGPVNWQIGNSSDSIGLFFYPKGELLSPFSSGFWRLFLTKLQLFFTSYEWPQNLNVPLMERVVPVLKGAFVKFGFIVPVGVGGLLLLFKDWKKNFIFITFALSNVLWVVLFFITDRYRLPAVGCFSISAAYLMVWTVERLKGKKLLVPVSLWLFVGLFAFFFNATPGPLIPDTSYIIFSNISIRNIQYDLKHNNVEKAHKKALTYFRLAPNNYQSNYLLACTFYGQGQRDRALMFLNKTLQLNPDFQPAQDMLRYLLR